MHSFLKVAMLTASLLVGLVCQAAEAPGQWSRDKAQAWGRANPWPVGANYAPRYAINQLEMWQADTFDLKIIDQELGWAEGIGMNTMRVFLHDLLWEQDSQGFVQRIEAFLRVANRHHMKILFVIFDGVWDPHPYLGRQRPPRPHLHNSGWVQSPGRCILEDSARMDQLKPYVQGLLTHFRDDPRILGWDLFNEPNNPNTDAYGNIELRNKEEAAFELLRKTFAWAREVNPSQPLTAAVWLDLEGLHKAPPIYTFMLENSDIISFHNYAPVGDMTAEARELLARFQRPVLCSEYMARGTGCTFRPILGELRKLGVGAINWGLVDGKSQTKYPWDTWTKNYTTEPKLWHHDIFHADGSAYDPSETAYIRELTLQHTQSK